MNPANKLPESDAFNQFNALLTQYRDATTLPEIYELNGRVSTALNRVLELAKNDHSLPTMFAVQKAMNDLQVVSEEKNNLIQRATQLITNTINQIEPLPKRQYETKQKWP